MKKCIVLLLIIAILFLGGCSNPSVSDVTVNYESDEIFADLPKRIDNYDAYLKYVSGKKSNSSGSGLIENFVTADQLFVLGQWSSFSLEWPAFSGENGYWYWYGLKFPAVNGLIEGKVYVYHCPEQTFLKRMLFPFATEAELAKEDYTNSEWLGGPLMPRENPFRITRNGVSYQYNATGTLLFICWEIDGILYHMDMEQHFIDKLDRTSVMGRLLSFDKATAKAAFAEIKQALDAN